MGSYFDELKRRNVFRVAAAYAVVGWLAIEVVDTLAPRMGLPDWVPGFVILLLLIGFPVALLLSWAFELTPEGIRPSADAGSGAATPSTTGQKISVLVIAALAAVVLFQAFAPSLGTLSPFADTPAEAEPIAVAVLPFADLSPGGDQEYLGDGVAEEILNVLARIEGLKVTSRTSAFAFKDQQRPLPEIAAMLGASHVVEGSVRKQNDRVRITAQLIDVAEDAHLWSETYDSRLDDIFRLQDEIARQIAAALSESLDLGLPAVVRETREWDVAAYELYLRARQLVVARTDYGRALDLLDTAIELEPEFADAWAEKATALALIGYDLGEVDATVDEALATLEQAWLAARRAGEIDPRHPLALAVKGLVRMNQKRWIEARVFYDRALAVDNPNDYAFLWLGILQASTGDSDGALATFAAGLERSPTAPNLIRYRKIIQSVRGDWQVMVDEGIDPNTPTMEQTIFHQLLAELHLGDISLEEFVDWKRTQSTPTGGTGAIEPVIAAAASVFGDAPLPDLALFANEDNITLQDMVLIQPALIHAYFEDNAAAILHRPHRNDLELLWTRGAESFRATDTFVALVRDLDLPAYWDLYGWPELCRPTGYRDFECD